jgi:hypothetical protein
LGSVEFLHGAVHESELTAFFMGSATGVSSVLIINPTLLHSFEVAAALLSLPQVHCIPTLGATDLVDEGSLLLLNVDLIPKSEVEVRVLEEEVFALDEQNLEIPDEIEVQLSFLHLLGLAIQTAAQVTHALSHHVVLILLWLPHHRHSRQLNSFLPSEEGVLLVLSCHGDDVVVSCVVREGVLGFKCLVLFGAIFEAEVVETNRPLGVAVEKLHNVRLAVFQLGLEDGLPLLHLGQTLRIHFNFILFVLSYQVVEVLGETSEDVELIHEFGSVVD